METQNYLNCSLNDNLTFTTSNNVGSLSSGSLYTCWDYWHQHYYPEVIYHSYPIYLQERATDKGKQAFEIIKMLKDKRFMKLETVGDFIDAMDCLIKIL